MPATTATLDHFNLVESKTAGHVTVLTAVHFETGNPTAGDGLGATIHVELELPLDFKIGDLKAAVDAAMKARIADVSGASAVELQKTFEGWQP